MKKIIGRMIILFYAFLCAGCTSSKEMETEDVTSAMSNVIAKTADTESLRVEKYTGLYSTMEEIEALDIPEEMLAYWLVLHNKKPFVSANEGCQEFYWDEYFWCLFKPDPMFTIYDFGIVDLDNDGSHELVLTGFPETTQILDYQEGTVYSYQTAFRGMAGILTNGIYNSSSAYDIGGWHRIAYFDKGTYEEETLAYMNHDYFEVEGKEVSLEEFLAYIEPFAKGEQIERADYTEEMLDKILLGDLEKEELSMIKHVIPEKICDENNSYMADVPEVYLDVLKGNEAFICVTEKGQEFIVDGNSIRNPEGEEAGQVLYFSIVDMEGDGKAEVVLTCAGENLSAGENLILHTIEGAVYGYVFDFWGEMGEITNDGVFRMGTRSSQYGKITSFDKTGCTIETVKNYEYADDNRIQYYFFDGTP